MKSLLLVMSGVCALLVGCVPALEDGPEVAASRYCDRSVVCGWHDEAELADCNTILTDLFSDMWERGGCEEGYAREEWGACMDTIDELDCESWTRGLDVVADDCERATVCK